MYENGLSLHEQQLQAKQAAYQAMLDLQPFPYSVSGYNQQSTATTLTYTSSIQFDEEVVFSARAQHTYYIRSKINLYNPITGSGVQLMITGTNKNFIFSGTAAIISGSDVSYQWLTNNSPVTITSTTNFNTVVFDGIVYHGTLAQGTTIGTIGLGHRQAQSGQTTYMVGSGIQWNLLA